MNEQIFFWSINIKFLRERRRMSQDMLSERLGISRVKLNALENGHTKSPSLNDLAKFSEFFKMSIDSLVKVDLSQLGAYQLRELEAGNDIYATGTKIRILAITVDKDQKENMEYVPVKAKAGYRAGFNDPDYISSLPRFSAPNLPKGKTFRMFPTTGDSMLPIPEGADIITEYIQDWPSIKPGTPCIVILKSEGADFVFKLVTYTSEDGSILQLRSLNDAYETYMVPVSEVLEIWKFYSYTSKKIPETEAGLPEVLQSIKSMHRDIRELKEGR